MEQPTETLGPTTAAYAAKGTTPSVRHPCAAGPGALHTAHKPGYLPISSTAPWVVRVPQAAPEPDTNWPMGRAFPFGLGDLSRIQMLLSLRVPATKGGHADLGKAAKAMGLSRTQGRDKVCFDRTPPRPALPVPPPDLPKYRKFIPICPVCRAPSACPTYVNHSNLSRAPPLPATCPAHMARLPPTCPGTTCREPHILANQSRSGDETVRRNSP